jgi:hypothetical protein
MMKKHKRIQPNHVRFAWDFYHELYYKYVYQNKNAGEIEDKLKLSANSSARNLCESYIINHKSLFE